MSLRSNCWLNQTILTFTHLLPLCQRLTDHRSVEFVLHPADVRIRADAVPERYTQTNQVNHLNYEGKVLKLPLGVR